ncbi:MAG: hypothetical protein RLZZ383_198 [Pseudomonadota bacterium]|jgi:tRNA threonylcarbamoyl adenosine modification protein YeaZ
MNAWIGIDTSAPVVGVAVGCGDRHAERVARVAAGAERILVPWIEACLAELGVERRDIAGVVVAAGPGTFTGLRVGMAAALGYAMGLRIETAEVSSLASRASRARGLGVRGPLLTLLDARKGNAYARWEDGDGEVRADDLDLPIADVLALAPDLVAGGFAVAGEGALAFQSSVVAAGGTLVSEPSDPALHALIALGRAHARAVQAVPTWTPRYVRPPDAKRPGT